MPQEWKSVQVSHSPRRGTDMKNNCFGFVSSFVTLTICFFSFWIHARSRTRWRTLWKATVPVNAISEGGERLVIRSVATSEVGVKSDYIRNFR